MKFKVKALSAAGDVVSLTLDASDQADAGRRAADQGLGVIEVRAPYPFAARLAALVPPPRSGFVLGLFCQELVALIDAGLTLVEAVDLLDAKEQARPAARLLHELSADLHGGLSFSAALARQPGAFPALFVATVHACERSGDVGPGVARFHAYHEQLDRVRRRIVSASIYPLLLLVLGLLATTFMLVFVVPRFSRIYEEFGHQLPWLTRLLISWGRLLEDQVGLVAALLVGTMAALAWLASRPALWRWLLPRLWRLPAIGERWRVYELARFYRTLGMLLASGISLPAALDLAAGLLSPLLRGALAKAALAIRQGQAVSQAFAHAGLTTPVSQRLLGVGESSGRLAQLVERIAAFHDDEIARWVDWFTRLFEPALMAVIGAVIGFIIVLLYLPIFELAGTIR